MIKAHFLYTSKQICGFELTGHAESGEYGQDIVCAGVSALAISTVNGLQKLAKAQIELTADEEHGGYLKVSLDSAEKGNQAAALLLASFKLGMEEIATSYAKYIEIS
ncbi:ribosomal-processing cysteine protease Prp [Liquorilactobacillus satsumensis]|uniref:ribosomal-processing cysteine protease Prp n=1 Tax=Liquorilactobacillus satsumensis TaxID=259059 RepID=UPI001E411B9F|nr:ribosomal-processing cysteine protease Prp [Liquorilactobacillus satsumensis]MCC7665862.1 ribosomal-processing cysteine protease Prp [Liquorilactobacillus satsumensis]MCP9356570.1 ribosomal-processing cysteine protease Prp [Liquorilactobacillus satsumensis]MCP9370510.1 ribosomal-processing cysteine protease Prp [Liquorilactobacillus satsumensis]